MFLTHLSFLPRVQFDSFWEASFITGRIAILSEAIAKDILPDEAYIAGTLCTWEKSY